MPETPPLPSGDEEAEADGDAPSPVPAPSDAAAPSADAARPAPPASPPLQFKPMTAFLTFLFVLGLMMIFDQEVRNGVAGVAVGPVFWPIFGFSGHYPLLTMAIVGILEMLATALAYNWATDWMKAAKFGKWNAAFRKVQMAALRSGKKDRIDALQSHQQTLTKLSTDVNFAQMKGLAVTWFLVIAFYTWVFLFLYGCAAAPGSACSVGPAPIHTVNVAGATLDLTGKVWIIPVWFLIFTFYTVPYSLLFRRILKQLSLRKYADRPASPSTAGPATGG